VFAALLDTCVLWPILQRDALLSFAAEGLYRPTWSSQILAELEYHEERKLIDRVQIDPAEARSRAAGLIQTMRDAFDDAEIVGWQALEGSFGLPDENDEHVLAAAVIGGAGVIVSHNLRDFPRHLVPSGIGLQSPAEFAHHTVSLNPPAALHAIATISVRSGRKGPHRTVSDILTILNDRYGFIDAVATLGSVRELET
jgi:PIN domain